MSRKNLLSMLFGFACALLVSSCSGSPKDDGGDGGGDDNTPTYKEGVFLSWPAYSLTIHYNFKDEYPNFPMPTQNLEDNVTGVKAVYNDRWWTFIVGNNANALVTESAITPMLERMNNDFAYIRDVMGWPPDRNAKSGYRSAIYLYGSGLSIDNASNTDLGGWQGSIWIPETGWWPMVHISYYPVYCFDPACTYGDKAYQTGGTVHEGIHAILSSLPGCRDAGWCHEATNGWIQRTMELERANTTDYSNVDLGWLSMGSVLAPFIPIECYSGWLTTDNSFGGPSAQGVSNNTRNLIGGIQYSTAFPTYMEIALGKGSIPWVWQNCPQRVLEGIANGLGAEQTKRLIREYRARMALADMGKYTDAVLSMYNAYMGASIVSENPATTVDEWKATPYVGGTINEDTLFVPDRATLPGWSGANIIPIEIQGNEAFVTFKAIGKNMSCQLCYRTSTGKTVYSNAFTDGEYKLSFTDNRPANNVIFAVVCNQDYVYKGDETRKAKFDYRLKFGKGVVKVADKSKKWYNWKVYPS